MSNSSYEKLLDKSANKHLGVESMWDAMAAQYNVSQNQQGMMDSQKIAEILHQKKCLMKNEVLDVGGGAGLYAIPFAGYAKQITITDISSNMLSYANENAKAAGFSNLKYIKLDWDKVNLKELGWEDHFDLVFSSMCPAIRAGEGIDKMIAASKNWCCINRIIQIKDSVSEKIEGLLNLSKEAETHYNRGKVPAIFNYLWENGYEPEIEYYEETTEKLLTVENSVNIYRKRFNKIAEEKKVNLRELIAGFAENNQLKVIRYKKQALLTGIFNLVMKQTEQPSCL